MSAAFWLTLTLAVYLAAERFHRACQRNALSHPLLVSVLILIPIVLMTHTPYSEYFDGVRILHLMLAPATVALAIPLFQHLHHVRRMLKPLLIALVVGGSTGIISALLLGRLFGLPHEALVSFTPKSVTTPIAMALADKLGGNASLAAAAVLFTGIFGALSADYLLRILRVRDETVQGFAIGVASHAVGTTRALQISHKAGAFSGLGLSLNGIFTSLALPLILAIWPL